jgi:hypothetical protein
MIFICGTVLRPGPARGRCAPGAPAAPGDHYRKTPTRAGKGSARSWSSPLPICSRFSAQLRQNEKSPARAHGLTWGNGVDDTGIEPVTSSVSGKRSPAELIVRVEPWEGIRRGGDGI